MPRLGSGKVPKLREHATGQGVVRLAGEDVYLGPFGSAECRERYDRAVAEWLARGRKPAGRDAAGGTVAGLVGEYLRYAGPRFRKRGKATSHGKRMAVPLRELASLYGGVPVGEFGPLALRALRGTWVARGVTRGTANKYAGEVVACVRWGVGMERVPAAVLVALEAVGGLREGRDGARERPPVVPVPEGDFRRAVAILPPVRAAMAWLQWWTGMRPGEVCAMKVGDLDRSGPFVIYNVAPEVNKTGHLGRSRTVMIGPKGQEVLMPLLKGKGREEYLFPPKGGKGPYNPRKYWAAVARACDKAGVPRFGPNRIRHAALTAIRAESGLEAAQAVAGHATTAMTEVYAERSLDVARKGVAGR